jgi:HPt (histidine-containing phosphotransfer) domain-containing protein
MDIQMPEMGGIEATQIIRNLEKNSAQHIRIIAVTASVMQGDRLAFLEAGMDDYISKPIRVNELVQVLLNSHANDSIQNIEAESGTILEQPAINMQVFHDLEKVIGSDKSSPVIVPLIDTYLRSLLEFQAVILNGIKNQDISVVTMAVHSLKTSSSSLGALILADICGRLEKKIMDGAIARGELIRECDRVKLALEKQKQELI